MQKHRLSWPRKDGTKGSMLFPGTLTSVLPRASLAPETVPTVSTVKLDSGETISLLAGTSSHTFREREILTLTRTEGNEIQEVKGTEVKGKEVKGKDLKGKEAKGKEANGKEESKEGTLKVAQNEESFEESASHETNAKTLGDVALDNIAVEAASSKSGFSDCISPVPLTSFSPRDKLAAARAINLTHTLHELVQTEDGFVKSMRLLLSFVIEPSLLRCQHLRITCTPLIELEKGIHIILATHEAFLENLCVKIDDAVLAVFSNLKAYVDYSSAVDIVLLLFKKRTVPFQSGFVQSLQRFLENYQPKQRNMDLSLLLLLQKPMARIGKYQLFLLALVKLDPHYGGALQKVKDSLTEINYLLAANVTKLQALTAVNAHTNYSVTVGKCAHFCGLMEYTGQCTAFWITTEFEVNSNPVGLVLYKNHLVTTHKGKIVLFVPFSACQFMLDANGVTGGLCANTRTLTKVIFEKDGCQYEMMFIFLDSEHQKFVEACKDAPTKPLGYPNSSDCHILPKLGVYDLDLNDNAVFELRHSLCYFKQLKLIRPIR